MSKQQFLIKFDPETGDRLETYPYDESITEDIAVAMLRDGYEAVSYDTWWKLIGNYDGKIWIKDVVNGGFIHKPDYVPSLEEVKEQKIANFKKWRDIAEVQPIWYHKHPYDYDEKARERISIALTALRVTGGEINWTTAQDEDVPVTAEDLENILLKVAARSGELHAKYRELKTQILAAQTVEEVNAINWTN